MDTLQPTASQEYVTQILVPPVIAWGLQMMVGAYATTRAWDMLNIGHGRRSMTSTIPYARPMLLAAILFNTFGMLVCFWELADFSIRQDRSFGIMSGARLCRAMAPIPIGLTAAITQSFMAFRCWRLARSNIFFGVIVAILITLSLASALTFSGLLLGPAFTGGRNFTASLVCPQLFSWASLCVDTLITCVLVHNLRMRKQDGLPKRAENLVNGLIRVSFETCAIPWFLVLASCIVGGIAFKFVVLRATYWALCAVTPSLYLLSFVYCLEATTRRARSLSPSVSSQDEVENVPPCLCAHVRQFTIVTAEKGHDSTADGSANAQSWEAPHEWETLSVSPDSRQKRETQSALVRPAGPSQALSEQLRSMVRFPAVNRRQDGTTEPSAAFLQPCLHK